MKVLIIEACLVNHNDDRGGIDYANGDIADVAKNTANILVLNNRALYVNKIDDPDKGKRNTASAEMLRLAEKMVEEKKASTKEKAPA